MSTIFRALLRAVSTLCLSLLPVVACSSPQPSGIPAEAAQAPREDRVRVTTEPTTVEIAGAPRASRGERLVLHLDDVRVAEGQAAILRVFVNRPDATAETSVEQPGFVDELILVPSRSAPAAPGARSPGQNLALPLPAGLVSPGERLRVTLVPMGADAEGQLTEPGTADVTLAPPYITAEP